MDPSWVVQPQPPIDWVIWDMTSHVIHKCQCPYQRLGPYDPTNAQNDPTNHPTKSWYTKNMCNMLLISETPCMIEVKVPGTMKPSSRNSSQKKQQKIGKSRCHLICHWFVFTWDSWDPNFSSLVLAIEVDMYRRWWLLLGCSLWAGSPKSSGEWDPKISNEPGCGSANFFNEMWKRIFLMKCPWNFERTPSSMHVFFNGNPKAFGRYVLRHLT